MKFGVHAQVITLLERFLGKFKLRCQLKDLYWPFHADMQANWSNRLGSMHKYHCFWTIQASRQACRQAGRPAGRQACTACFTYNSIRNLVFLADFLADVPANLQKLAIFGRRSFKETNYLFQNIYLFYKRLPKNTQDLQMFWHLCQKVCQKHKILPASLAHLRPKLLMSFVRVRQTELDAVVSLLKGTCLGPKPGKCTNKVW